MSLLPGFCDTVTQTGKNGCQQEKKLQASTESHTRISLTPMVSHNASIFHLRNRKKTKVY